MTHAEDALREEPPCPRTRERSGKPSQRRHGAPSTAAVAALVMFGATAPASAETITIYAAGSLTKVVDGLAKEAGQMTGVEVKPVFGPSGQLRSRIEVGETPDLFLSADMAAPRRLEDEKRTVMPPIAFAQNRMCLAAKRSLGMTADNITETLLAKPTRIKTSTPVEDPGGDYAMAIFDKIDAQHPGAGVVLRQKAQATADATKNARPMTGRSAAASLFLDDKVDVMITYCSGAPALKQDADVSIIFVPSAFEPHPVNGMAVLSAKPGALRLALYLMSEKGQGMVTAAGLLPLLQTKP